MTKNLVVTVRNLQQRKGRRKSPLAVAEGVRLVEEALAAGVTIEGALVTAGFGESPRDAALMADLARRAVPMETVTERVLLELADTTTPQGILAVVTPPQWPLADILPAARAPVLVLDAVQDPGNVGALLRTAHGLGAAGTILLKGSADPTHPKVLRAAMGASFRLKTATADIGAFVAWVAAAQVIVWATDTEGVPLGRAKAPDRLAIVVGNEGAGVRPEVRALAAERVAIPLARGAESLNVAVAAGIVLHAVTRAS
ncbi:MAG TPA: RNA methyltransferase [Gemmatimonadales bacterium]